MDLLFAKSKTPSGVAFKYIGDANLDHGKSLHQKRSLSRKDCSHRAPFWDTMIRRKVLQKPLYQLVLSRFFSL